MKKSCYAIKQTKIERFILSPCLSNKDSLAKDRVSVFWKVTRKKKITCQIKNKKFNQNAKLWQFKCPEQFCFEKYFVGFFCPWKMIGHRFMWSWCLFKRTFALPFSHKKQKTNALQKQEKVRKRSVLFYNNSSASCLHWFISRNNTPHLFLVPYPFKIEASLENSLSLQCTYLCIFVSVFELSWILTRFICGVATMLPVRLTTKWQTSTRLMNT